MKRQITTFKLDSDSNMEMINELVNSSDNVEIQLSFKPIIEIIENNKIQKYDTYSAIQDLTDLILNKKNESKEDYIDGVISCELPSSFLIKHFGCKHYRKIITLFNEYIYEIKQNGYRYIPKQNATDGIGKCKTYLINYKELLTDPHLIVRFNNKSLIEFQIDDDANINMVKVINEAEMDYGKAIMEQIINKKNDISLINRIREIIKFANRRYIKIKKDTTGRIFSNFSSMPKECRKHITLSNKHFIELDVKNSQPSLLVGFMNELGYIADKNYIKDVENGTIYSNFILLQGDFYKFDEATSRMIIYSNILKNKGDVKKEFFNSILFDFKTKSTLNIRFKELYPLVWEFLRKQNNNIEIAGQLQKRESEIINNLDIQVPYYSVFDAVFLRTNTEYQITKVKNTIKRKYKDYTGLNIQVDINLIK